MLQNANLARQLDSSDFNSLSEILLINSANLQWTAF